MRYADENVAGFQHEADAKTFLAELGERLAKFALSQPTECEGDFALAVAIDVLPIDDHFRHKIGDDPNRPRYILTVHGVGYKFAP